MQIDFNHISTLTPSARSTNQYSPNNPQQPSILPNSHHFLPIINKSMTLDVLTNISSISITYRNSTSLTADLYNKMFNVMVI